MWRIVDISEYELIEALPKNDETVEWWNGLYWDLVPTLFLNPKEVYRTKRPFALV